MSIFSTFLALAGQPGALRVLCASKVHSVESAIVTYSLRKMCPDISTVIDIGANVGQFSCAIKTTFPQVTIYALEPHPSAAKALTKNLSKYHDVHVECVAAGDKPGYLQFNVNSFSQVSSLLGINKSNEHPMYHKGVSQTIKVEVVTLDRFLSGTQLRGPVLMKIDTQGYEKYVLKGSMNLLSRTKYLLLEMAFCPLYENQPLFDEMHQFVTDLGFGLHAPLSSHLNVDATVMEMDVLYIKKRFSC